MKDPQCAHHAASVHPMLAIARQLAGQHDGRMMQSNAVPMSAAHVCLDTGRERMHGADGGYRNVLHRRITQPIMKTQPVAK
ncbi:hypothetical protein [Xanthomonas campestris]|uniref:Uncharacterized protein n=1 Tax=Xanthomonas campestris pv. papavericola TaxID=487881 RepID=A0AAJ2X3D4_XANCA|nr:hypothetical protein [Xanthomonas campestris]MEC3887949.1 hypothetical protein [Xanthomonas campestris pv. papavericola]